MQKIILSKGRHETITTHNLLRDYRVLVPESEQHLYAEVVDPKCIDTIPDSVRGLAAIRNWVIKNYDQDVCMIDDDIKCFFTLCRKKAHKVTNPDVIDQVIANCYINALDAGARVFGFAQMGADVRKYKPDDPFKLVSWTGTIIGIIGKELKFDERNKLRVDADFCLQSLGEDRIVWIDTRFSFDCIRDTNKGGNANLRSKENLEREKRYLKMKWGSHIRFKKASQREGLSIIAKRKDPDIKYE